MAEVSIAAAAEFLAPVLQHGMVISRLDCSG